MRKDGRSSWAWWWMVCKNMVKCNWHGKKHIKYCAILQLRNVKMERIVKIRLWSCIIGYLTFTEVRWAWARGKALWAKWSTCKMCINEVQFHIKRGQKQKFWTMNSHRRAKMINKQQQQDCGGRLSVYSTWWCSELHDGNGWSHWKLHRSVGHFCRVTQFWHGFKLIFTSVKALGGF